MKRQKQSVTQKVIAEFLFWLHTGVIILMLVAGLFFSIWVVLALLIIQRAQLLVFHGCIITRLEERAGGIPKGTAYFHLAFQRFFGVKLSKMGVHLVSLAVTACGAAVVILANLWHVRLHL